MPVSVGQLLPDDDRIEYGSDGDFVDIREEDTTPGDLSEVRRKLLERKYGRKPSPPQPPPDTDPKAS